MWWQQEDSVTGQGTLSGLCSDDSHRLQKGAPLVTSSPLSFIPSGPTCKGAAELLEVSQDLLAQEVDETGDNLRDKEGDNRQSWRGSLSWNPPAQPTLLPRKSRILGIPGGTDA